MNVLLYGEKDVLQNSSFGYLYRFLQNALLGIVSLLLLAAVISAAGARSVFAAPTTPRAPLSASTGSDSVNTVTVGLERVVQNTKYNLLRAGASVYAACKKTTDKTVSVSQATGVGMLASSKALGSGALYAWRGTVAAVGGAGKSIGKTVSAIGHAPADFVHNATRADTVSTFMKPADNDTQMPVITKTSAAAYDQLDEAHRQKIARFLAEQAEANRALQGTIVAGSTNRGGYPAAWNNARQDSLVDSWGMYNRECVSYAAWKVHQTYGNMPYWGGVGNANQWPRNARRAGIPTGRTPAVHSVAISLNGYYGHAMWVEKVKGDMIYVSQYNWDLRGHYSEMWVNSRNLIFIYFRS
ncbi:hypothetical protein CSA80_03090 [Candidatus Saccharibacteria bacterium]|nr:MAG: hypothetical protein CR973_00245 [Candidatus Saccharibacteria bacterium]PID99074.1 MAG: hypothetical protein CSA80_03090 [Candidatus Saccharibacteria bacterium]